MGWSEDSFFDTAATALASHVPTKISDDSARAGKSWARSTATGVNGGTLVVSDANRIRGNTSGQGFLYIISDTPDVDANYDVQIVIHTFTNLSGVTLGVAGRIVNSSTRSYYDVHYDGTDQKVHLSLANAGSPTDLAVSSALSWANGSDHTLTLRMRGNQISALVDGTVVAGPVTDNTLSAAGSAGIVGQQSSTNTTGFHGDNWQAIDPSAATAYSITGPTTGPVGSPSSAFTVVANGSLAGNITITPSDGGAGGTFSPASITLPSGTAPQVTFTYTAASTGAKTLSFSNNGGLTDQTNLTYTPFIQVAVTDPNMQFSPWNWWSDGTGAMGANGIRGGSSYAQTNCEGAWIKLGFTGTSVQINLDVSPLAGLAAGNYPTVVLVVDGKTANSTQLTSSTTNVQVTGLSAGNHNAWFFYRNRGADTVNRWNAGSPPYLCVRVTGVTIDGGANLISLVGTGLELWPANMLNYGDSILGNEYETNWSIRDYGHLLAMAMGYEEGRVAFSGIGLTHVMTGGSGAQTFLDTYLNYDSLHSRLINGLLAPQPDIITINMGTNDGGASDNTVQANMQTVLAGLRSAAPHAPIMVIVPFGQSKASAITAAGSAMGDANIKLSNLGAKGNYGLGTGAASITGSDTTHPNVFGQAREACLLIHDFNRLLGNIVTTSARSSRNLVGRRKYQGEI